MPGGKEFKLTGSLGQVMQESAQAALSYVRALSDQLGIPADFWAQHDVHLHIPAGAQPKDGPSAGVTMAVALASLASGRAVRHEVGMTGEITLRGKVLPVGGVKEKVLAAHRARLKRVILPRRNEADLEDVPDEVRREMGFIFADTVQDVFEAALEPPVKRRRSKVDAGKADGAPTGKAVKRPRRRAPQAARKRTGGS
jgi:ATP-dependent Lon protease